MDLNGLIAQREALDRQINEQQAVQRILAVEEARRLVAQYDITPIELGIATIRRVNTSSVGPKFRNPETGKTWTGRGRAPAWIQGQDYTRFAISH